MTAGPRMQIDPLLALSPVDGRYARSTDVLRVHLSESALIRHRIRIEAAWLLALATEQPAGLPATATLSPALLAVATGLSRDPPASAAAAGRLGCRPTAAPSSLEMMS